MDYTTEAANLTSNEAPFNLLVFFGHTNPYFKLIHYTALVCLFISIVTSIYTSIFLARSGHGNIFKRKIGKVMKLTLKLLSLCNT